MMHWFDESIKPEKDRHVVVRDESGNEHDYHQWTGHAWYAFIKNDDGTYDGWKTDVNVVSWKYHEVI